MDYLRSASFGGLFTVTFVVAATFQIIMSLLGILLALVQPGMFQMNGVAAHGAGQALTTLVFLLVVCLVMNATVSSAGAGLWLLVRRLLPKASPITPG